jgi:putative hydrolase of the HAD superfamily
MRPPLKFVLFDVVNTLTFADLAVTMHPMAKRGLHPTDAQLRKAEIEARREVEAINASGSKLEPDAEYWRIFLTKLMQWMEVDDEALLTELTFEWRSARNWTRMAPETPIVLARLASRYDMAVISNSDGTMSRLLKHLDLARYFRTVTDSGVVGHQKPSPEIFHLALKSIGAAPEESVYIGDVYSIDILGAENVGMQAILADRLGSYSDLDVPKISKLDELETLLKSI